MLRHIKPGVLSVELYGGKGAHSKFRSFLSLFWLLLSAWSFCIFCMPAHTSGLSRSLWIAWALFELHCLFTSRPRIGLPQPWPYASRATGPSYLPAAKDHNFHWQCHRPRSPPTAPNQLSPFNLSSQVASPHVTLTWQNLYNDQSVEDGKSPRQ